ncbi:MAG: 2-amino-4-hydroxy-6-hydroxymethyldihydropteridine diphosphokinase [bacterium]
MNPEKYAVYLGLGSNLGERLIYLRLACKYLRSFKHTDILKYSNVYETKPVGFINQPDFLNAVIKINTLLKPLKLLEFIKRVERSIGRIETDQRWGPRIIDIDIINYEGVEFSSSRLKVPHKDLYSRVFWLKPLLELKAGFVDNGLVNKSALNSKDLLLKYKADFLR